MIRKILLINCLFFIQLSTTCQDLFTYEFASPDNYGTQYYDCGIIDSSSHTATVAIKYENLNNPVFQNYTAILHFDFEGNKIWETILPSLDVGLSLPNTEEYYFQPHGIKKVNSNFLIYGKKREKKYHDGEISYAYYIDKLGKIKWEFSFPLQKTGEFSTFLDAEVVNSKIYFLEGKGFNPIQSSTSYPFNNLLTSRLIEVDTLGGLIDSTNLSQLDTNTFNKKSFFQSMEKSNGNLFLSGVNKDKEVNMVFYKLDSSLAITKNLNLSFSTDVATGGKILFWDYPNSVGIVIQNDFNILNDTLAFYSYSFLNDTVEYILLGGALNLNHYYYGHPNILAARENSQTPIYHVINKFSNATQPVICEIPSYSTNLLHVEGDNNGIVFYILAEDTLNPTMSTIYSFVFNNSGKLISSFNFLNFNLALDGHLLNCYADYCLVYSSTNNTGFLGKSVSLIKFQNATEIINSRTKIKGLKKKSIIFPHPITKGQVNFSAPVSNVKIFNSEGKLVFFSLKNSISLLTLDLPNGIYHLDLEVNNHRQTQKLIIKN